MEMTHECLWDSCDYQFEEISDCLEHCIGEGGNMIGTFIETKKAKLEPGHVQQHYRGHSGNEYPCLWRNCNRVRKGQAPFPNLPRLLRHVRDLHINKGNGKPMPLHERSRNFFPSSKKPAKQATALRNVMSPVAGVPGRSPSPAGVPAGPKPEPMFVTAPPKEHRLQHSAAYIRYIEGLHSDQKYITPWEKSLTPMPINPDPAQFNMAKLPSHWMTEEAINGFLAQDKSLSETDIKNMDQNTKILKGLCALRDYMMKDALNVYKSNTFYSI